MDIRQLKYFLTIKEEENISRAAERLHISQPPLSQQLKLLEDELGAVLFDRNTRKLNLTPVGEALARRAEQILELFEMTLLEVSDINNGLEGTLKIGTVSSVVATFLPDLSKTFHNIYTRIKYEIIDEDSKTIIDLLKNGLIDIGIIRTPAYIEQFEHIMLPEIPFKAVVANKLQDICTESVTAVDLVNHDLIIHQRHEAMIMDMFIRNNLRPRILLKSNDIRSMLLFANSGLGTAIVPEDSINLMPDLKLKSVDICESDLKVGTSIIWPKNKYISKATENFLKLITH